AVSAEQAIGTVASESELSSRGSLNDDALPDLVRRNDVQLVIGHGLRTYPLCQRVASWLQPSRRSVQRLAANRVCPSSILCDSPPMSDWRLVSGDAGWSAIAEILRAHRAPCAVTMGTFDGVHAGHRSLVAATRRLAVGQGLDVVAVTFAPRPERYFADGAVLPDLCSIDERISRLRAAGADRVVVL